MTRTHSPTVDQENLREQVHDSLNAALEADTEKMKNYHIRNALQYCVIQAEHQ